MSTEPNTLPFEYQIRSSDIKQPSDGETRDRQLEDYLATLPRTSGGGLTYAIGADISGGGTGPYTSPVYTPTFIGAYDHDAIFAAGDNTLTLPGSGVYWADIYVTVDLVPSVTPTGAGDYAEVIFNGSVLDQFLPYPLFQGHGVVTLHQQFHSLALGGVAMAFTLNTDLDWTVASFGVALGYTTVTYP